MTQLDPWLSGLDLQAVVWGSDALVCVVADSAWAIVAVNPAFARQGGENLVGRPLTTVVNEGQAHAFDAWLRGLGSEWDTRIWGVLPDTDKLPRDFRVSACCRPDGAIVLIGEQLMVDDVASALMHVNQDMVREHRRIDRERGRLDRMTQEDALTGVANRRAFEMRLGAEVRGGPLDSPFAIVMLDLDHFKDLNDRHGHPVGDVVLQWLGGLLRTAARRSDFVARYGGEEFVAILRDAGLDDGLAWAERLRLEIRAESPPGLAETVTATLGVAAWEPGESARDVVRRADEALYRAKRAGRDRVGGASIEPLEPVGRTAT